jgi:hypothetical protein
LLGRLVIFNWCWTKILNLQYLLSSFKTMFVVRLLIMMQVLLQFKTAFQFSQIHSLSSLVYLNPFLSFFMEGNLLRLPQLLYGTMYYLKHEQQCFIRYTRLCLISLGLIKNGLLMFYINRSSKDRSSKDRSSKDRSSKFIGKVIFKKYVV